MALVHDLANVYSGLGLHGRALELYSRAVVGSEQQSGPEDLASLRYTSSLALAYMRDGRTLEAAAMFQRVRDTRERLLGSNHYDTVASDLMLARWHINQSEYREAERLARQAKMTLERQFSKESQDVIRARLILGSSLQALGRNVEAEDEMLNAIYAIERKSLNPRELASAYIDYAQTLVDGFGNRPAAIFFLKRVLATYTELETNIVLDGGIYEAERKPLLAAFQKENAVVSFQLAQLLAQEGRFGEADYFGRYAKLSLIHI